MSSDDDSCEVRLSRSAQKYLHSVEAATCRRLVEALSGLCRGWNRIRGHETCNRSEDTLTGGVAVLEVSEWSTQWTAGTVSGTVLCTSSQSLLEAKRTGRDGRRTHAIGRHASRHDLRGQCQFSA